MLGTRANTVTVRENCWMSVCVCMCMYMCVLSTKSHTVDGAQRTGQWTLRRLSISLVINSSRPLITATCSLWLFLFLSLSYTHVRLLLLVTHCMTNVTHEVQPEFLSAIIVCEYIWTDWSLWNVDRWFLLDLT